MDDQREVDVDVEPDDEEVLPHERSSKPREYEPNIVSEAAAEVCERPGDPPTQYWLRAGLIDRKRYLIIGFDTEYQQVHEYLDAATVRDGKAKYEPLSYQFYAIHPNTRTWSGIAIPPDGERMALSDFIVFVLAKGAQLCSWMPWRIILVGHYNKADVPAFEERKPILRRLSNVRNSLISRNMPINLRLKFSDVADDHADVAIYVRDTMLLAPAGKKSLASLGEMIGLNKLRLAADEAEERQIKSNMKVLRSLDWESYRSYALLDAEISARYFQQVTEMYQLETESKFVPTALSSIGMKLLVKDWGGDADYNVGREVVEEETYDERRGHIVTNKLHPYLEEVHWHINFITECYHGGRNEQFWFGPSFEANWTDYDLKGAYPTAMAMIGRPAWHAIREASLGELTQAALGFACVDFKFPKGTRYPTMPVRSQNGIIFPLEGRSYCGSPEIALAQTLGCDLTLKRAVIVPQDGSNLVFFPFIKYAIQRRQEADTDIERAFWKECANSCYGKTAQGLNDRRVFNLKDQKNERVPPSLITNPAYSGYITSFVRAVVGEVMNAVPAGKMVFSVTTDGFITNATKKEMEKATAGPLARAFGDSRRALTGKSEVLEPKHRVRQLLGWRTRGQATIKAGKGPVVLAKAGIKPPMEATEPTEQNQYILTTFASRTAESIIDMEFFTSVREMVLYNADLVRKRQVRRFSMEYDFKRKPISAVMAEFRVDELGVVQHLAFDTAPWNNIDDFNQVRKMRDHYWKSYRACLKTVDDYAEFAGFFDSMQQIGPQFGRYLRKVDGPLKRLRRDLCRAFKHGAAGLDRHQEITAQHFADILNRSGMETAGVLTRRADVENGRKVLFRPRTTPPTQQVLNVLSAVERELPGLRSADVLAPLPEKGIALSDAVSVLTPFTAKLVGIDPQ
jgi:hypothetical protein